jgi:predicted transglutaminase-like cysteine proteinase
MTPVSAAAVRPWRRILLRLVAFALAGVMLLSTGISDGTAMLRAPLLFGADAAYSSDLRGFKKWRGALDRLARDLADPANPDAKAWRRFVAALPAVDSGPSLLQAVNTAVNARRYVTDPVNWGQGDYWASPVEFLRRSGDCEDFAVAKYVALRQLGVPADDMRVVVLDDMQLGITHAILAVRGDAEFYILDNQRKDVMPAAAIPHYRPIYAVNEQGWWNYESD